MSAEELKMKDLILKVAFEKITEKGYHGTSIRDIAKEADISIGSIYTYFPNKEAMYKTLIEEFHPFKGAIKFLLNTKPCPPDKFFHNMSQAWLDEVELDKLKLIFIDFTEFRGQNLFTYTMNFFHQEMETVQELVSSVLKQGNLRDYDPHFIMMFFHQMIIQFITHGHILMGKEKTQLKEELTKIVNIYLYGILKE